MEEVEIENRVKEELISELRLHNESFSCLFFMVE